jgi:Uma2 family endonuclease
MEHPAETKRFTLAEYVEAEELAESKNEFYDGQIRKKPFVVPEHSFLAANCGSALKNAFKPTGCRIFDSSLRIQVEQLNNVLYPDASVICGQLDRDPNSPTLVRNPVLVLEVLSKSTAAYDRGSKFHMYQMIPSLKTYVLVEQSQPRVYVHFKNDDGAWDVNHYFGLEDIVVLKPLGVSLAMTEIYEEIIF